MLGQTLEMDLMRGMHSVDELYMPTDKDVAGFGDNEQAVIQESMEYARRRAGATQAALASQMGINKSQWSLLYDGQRGIPVGRFLSFIRTTGNLGLLKFYAMNVGCVLKTRREWGAKVREANEAIERADAAEKRALEAEKKLSMYEEVA